MNDSIFYVYQRSLNKKYSSSYRVYDGNVAVLNKQVTYLRYLCQGDQVFSGKDFIVVLWKGDIVYHTKLPVPLPAVSQRTAILAHLLGEPDEVMNLNPRAIEDFAWELTFDFVKQKIDCGSIVVEPFTGTKPFVAVDSGMWCPLDKLVECCANSTVRGIFKLPYMQLAEYAYRNMVKVKEVSLAECELKPIQESKQAFTPIKLPNAKTSISRPLSRQRTQDSTTIMSRMTSLSQFSLPELTAEEYWNDSSEKQYHDIRDDSDGIDGGDGSNARPPCE